MHAIDRDRPSWLELAKKFSTSETIQRNTSLRETENLVFQLEA